MSAEHTIIIDGVHTIEDGVLKVAGVAAEAIKKVEVEIESIIEDIEKVADEEKAPEPKSEDEPASE